MFAGTFAEVVAEMRASAADAPDARAVTAAPPTPRRLPNLSLACSMRRHGLCAEDGSDPVGQGGRVSEAQSEGGVRVGQGVALGL